MTVEQRLLELAEKATWATCSWDPMEYPHYVNDLTHLSEAGGRVTDESCEWVAACDPQTIARLCRVVEAARAAQDHRCDVRCDKWSSDTDAWRPCVGATFRDALAALDVTPYQHISQQENDRG